MGTMTQLPPELVLGWALWIIGGLLLTLWFVRRSSPRLREAVPSGAAASGVRLSGTHAASRSPSGVQVRPQSAAQVPAAHSKAQAPVRSQSAARQPVAHSSAVHGDAFDELRALLDSQGEPPASQV